MLRTLLNIQGFALFCVSNEEGDAECSEIDPKESVYKNFGTINTGYPGIFGQEVRIKEVNYYNQKFTYRTLYVFLCL
jgi:hypothetical protein